MIEGVDGITQWDEQYMCLLPAENGRQDMSGRRHAERAFTFRQHMLNHSTLSALSVYRVKAVVSFGSRTAWQNLSQSVNKAGWVMNATRGSLEPKPISEIQASQTSQLPKDLTHFSQNSQGS